MSSLKEENLLRHRRQSQKSNASSQRSSIVVARSSFVKDEKNLGLHKDSKTGQLRSSQMHEEDAKIGTINCMFLLFSGAMGSGVLSLPTVVLHNGLFVGILLLVIGGVFSAVSQYYLMKCTRVANEEREIAGKKPITSYSGLMEYAAEKCWPGKSASWVQLTLNMMFVFYIWGGVVVACTQYMFTFSNDIMNVAPEGREAHSMWSFLLGSETLGDGRERLSFNWSILFGLAGIWFVLCMPKDLSALRYIALYPFATIMITALFTVVAFFALDKPGWDGPNFEQTIERFSFNRVHGAWPILILSSRFVFAYMTHTNVVTVAAALEDRVNNDKSAMKISVVNVAAIAVSYSMICVMSCLVAGKKVEMPFTSFYTKVDDQTIAMMARVISVMILAMMIAAIPLNFTPLRQSVWEIYLYFTKSEKFVDQDDENLADAETQGLLPKEGSEEDADDMSFQARAIVTASLLVSGVIGAKLIPGLDVVIDIIGGSLGVFLMIAGPAFMMRQLLTEKDSKRANMWSWVFLVFTAFCACGFVVTQMGKFMAGMSEDNCIGSLVAKVNVLTKDPPKTE